ncbi:hypothetical protein CcrC1_gp517 [Caulobacter phage C1]|nr:hypothetical protein CcrC1_gp024 [Caulobacter phage C1]UTU08251.1 hypothetical protein CcrC2_gp023 [Caulobacter phage C2]UTU08774.1 hypothetical protein CcrJ4_gp023 [Caulobacter phage J4]UTU09310.1 hypothetical protein CcrBL47_gp024 [Caulobacter phage BL47]UTU09886.1 hypothetical protein CcrRB23_gp024 [Caulobacter phage RB23]WGN96910.1 hypothetical protein [Bertelyvirus sp.]
MTLTYRTDYTPDDGKTIEVSDPMTREQAMRQAAYLSRTYGTAYAIASDGKRDTGQRVYQDGRFAYQDDKF